MKEELFCKVGDEVVFLKHVQTSPWDADEGAEHISIGSRYRAIALVSNGRDLVKINGKGPSKIRILDSELASYVKVGFR